VNVSDEDLALLKEMHKRAEEVRLQYLQRLRERFKARDRSEQELFDQVDSIISGLERVMYVYKAASGLLRTTGADMTSAQMRSAHTRKLNAALEFLDRMDLPV
jgi:hypothetical protein